MWQSIIKIQKPNSLQDALGLVDNNAAFLSGGSYLILEKNPDISTLIDINSLLSSEIVQDGDDITIGAKTSLQELADCQPGIVSDCIRWSCFSKNIRNQRTIGGEIGRRRVDSEIYSLLYTMDVQLEVFNGEMAETTIRQFDGIGIITRLILKRSIIDNSLVKRFALLRSAPAFLITTSTKSQESVSFSIGGKVNKIFNHSISNPHSASSIDNIIGISSSHFLDDHYGSREYKKALLKTALKRLVEGR
ncbi:MAG: hypothetical protein HN729_04115 [Candidatus Marinimicrobia bacterium]|jgi:putative selenate reductase FAD-binding subunit|nr:hypothetical protein [Candidatus Neomarinimicrobiota bacterium]MBT3633743.1 hypothetical protein [Candidatus Neomarinimicrobiota bacterium]MBT3682535.1 hypothetical protein [Candidatus Neomarinimicrobiota bacterium]MBT3759299.1 hypothetical protein [Candidatus Neomarinimicrobiota bacterium]MBT3894693.1 hypothetical protein [Candidatus Neomarinimicrobiota bacterium]